MKKSIQNMTNGKQAQLFSADFLAPLIRDVLLLILGLLSNKDLQTVALVNKRAYALSKNVRLKRFEKKHEASHLWRYLHSVCKTSINNEAIFVSYLRKAFGQEFNIEEDWLKLNNNLYNYIYNWIKEFKDFNDVLPALGFSSTGYLVTKNRIQELVQYAFKYSSISEFLSCSSLNAFINLSRVQDRLIVWKMYSDLDTVLSTMILFTALKNLPIQQRLTFLIYSPLNRVLTTDTWLELDKIFSGLFTDILLDLIRLIELKSKNDDDKKRLLVIKDIISRLNETDFIKYLDVVQNRYTKREYFETKLMILLSILKNDCKIISYKINSEFIQKIIYNPFSSEFIYSYIYDIIILIILERESLKKISNFTIRYILKKVHFSKLFEIICRNVYYCSKFNFNLVIDLLENILETNTDKSTIVRLCFTENDLVKNFTSFQFMVLINYLTNYDFDNVLSSRVFRKNIEFNACDFVNNLIIYFKPSKYFIALLKDIYFGKYISKNNYYSINSNADKLINVLTNYDIIEISIAHPYFGIYILKDKLRRFSIYELVCVENFYSGRNLSIEHHEIYGIFRQETINRQSFIISDGYEYFYSDKYRKNMLRRKVGTYINWFLIVGMVSVILLSFISFFLFLCLFFVACIEVEKTHFSLLKMKNYGGLSYFILFLLYKILTFVQNIWSAIDFQIIKTVYEEPPMLDESQLPKYCFFPIQKRKESPELTSNCNKNNNLLQIDSTIISEHKPIVVSNTENTDILRWVLFVIQMVSIFSILIGLMLVGAGLGSALGIGVMATTVEFLFSYSILGSAFTSALVGSIVYMTSLVTWLITDIALQVPNTGSMKLGSQTSSNIVSTHKTEKISLHRFCIDYQNTLNLSGKKDSFFKHSDLVHIDPNKDDNIDDVVVLKL